MIVVLVLQISHILTQATEMGQTKKVNLLWNSALLLTEIDVRELLILLIVFDAF